jgi:hypothetical protein
MVALLMKPASVSNSKGSVPIPQPNSRRSRESFGSLPSASSPLTTQGSSFDRLNASSPPRKFTDLSQSRLSLESRSSVWHQEAFPASSIRHGFELKRPPVPVVPESSSSKGVQRHRGLLAASLSQSAPSREPTAEALLQVCTIGRTQMSKLDVL